MSCVESCQPSRGNSQPPHLLSQVDNNSRRTAESQTLFRSSAHSHLPHQQSHSQDLLSQSLNSSFLKKHLQLEEGKKALLDSHSWFLHPCSVDENCQMFPKWNKILPEHWLEIIPHSPILGKALQQGAQLSYVDAPLSLRRLRGLGGCERVEG